VSRTQVEKGAGAKAPTKLTAVTVPSECVPVELLRKYSSPKPVLEQAPITRSQFLDALKKVSRKQEEPPTDADKDKLKE
jgi:hypothetical protein